MKSISSEKNKIILSKNEDLLADSLIIDDINLQKFDKLPEDRDFIVKIRYRDAGAPARCKYIDENTLKIDFYEPRRAITPGQSVVIYDDNDLVGGGIIKNII